MMYIRILMLQCWLHNISSLSGHQTLFLSLISHLCNSPLLSLLEKTNHWLRILLFRTNTKFSIDCFIIYLRTCTLRSHIRTCPETQTWQRWVKNYDEGKINNIRYWHLLMRYRKCCRLCGLLSLYSTWYSSFIVFIRNIQTENISTPRERISKGKIKLRKCSLKLCDWLHLLSD